MKGERMMSKKKKLTQEEKNAKEIKKLKKHNKIHRISTFLKSIKINGK
jgi:hypothetical protein